MKAKTSTIIVSAAIVLILICYGIFRLLVYTQTDDSELIFEPVYSSPPHAKKSSDLFRKVLDLIASEEASAQELPPNETTYTIENVYLDSEENSEQAIQNAFAEKYGFTFEPDPEEPLMKFQIEEPSLELKALAQDNSGLVETFWQPIEDNQDLLDQLDKYPQIGDFYKLEDSVDLEDILKLTRFHVYKAYLLAARGNVNQGIQLLSRLLSILRKTHPNTQTLVSFLVVAHSENYLISHIAILSKDDEAKFGSVNHALDASLPAFDPIDDLERVLRAEVLFIYENAVKITPSKIGVFGVKLFLPNATINALSRYYEEVVELYRSGNGDRVPTHFEEFTNQAQGFRIRNIYGNLMLQMSTLRIPDIAPNVLEYEEQFSEYRTELENRILEIADAGK